MYKLCKTEQSAARQRLLEEGLLRAISQHRYDELSVSDLCSQMNIPRKSFYRYFSSKEGALHALLDHTLMSFDQFYIPSSTQPRTGGRQPGSLISSVLRDCLFVQSRSAAV